MTLKRIRDALACGRPRCRCMHPRERVTHCPAHDDQRPSLAISSNEGRVLIHCRAGCRQDSVIERLRARGLWHAPDPVVARTPQEETWLEIQRHLRHQRGWLARAEHHDADERRWCLQFVTKARSLATVLGDHDSAWDLLAQAADLERLLLNTD